VINRRAFVSGMAVGLLAAPVAVGAQQAGKVWRIGSLYPELPTTPQGQGSFYDRMRELGWVHGQNFIVERRAYGEQVERIPGIVTELLRLGVEVFIVTGAIDARRVQQVTRTVPIIASDAGDLLQVGLAASLARPGGNITGVQTLQPEVTGKHLALLKEAIPGFTRLGVLMGDPEISEAELRSQTFRHSIRAAEVNGKTLGIRLQIVAVHRAEELTGAFSAFGTGRAQAILVLRNNFTFVHRKTITDLGLKHRLPTISDLQLFASAGGLVSYGYDGREVSRLLAESIDQILRGTQASEVPIRQPTTFRLVINLNTAKTLGLTIPPSLLQRADQVIE